MGAEPRAPMIVVVGTVAATAARQRPNRMPLTSEPLNNQRARNHNSGRRPLRLPAGNRKTGRPNRQLGRNNSAGLMNPKPVKVPALGPSKRLKLRNSSSSAGAIRLALIKMPPIEITIVIAAPPPTQRNEKEIAVRLTKPLSGRAIVISATTIITTMAAIAPSRKRRNPASIADQGEMPARMLRRFSSPPPVLEIATISPAPARAAIRMMPRFPTQMIGARAAITSTLQANLADAKRSCPIPDGAGPKPNIPPESPA